MPELPDVEVYVERLRAYVVGQRLQSVRLASPFVLRSVEPPLQHLYERVTADVWRLGKQIVFGFEGDAFLLLHLMIAGRLRLRKPAAPLPARGALAMLDFERCSFLFSEVSKKKRAAMHVLQGRDALADFDRGGLELADASLDRFKTAMLAENHTLKRALTDPRILSGIGNAYSDEILFAARLSPFKQTHALDDAQWQCLFDATRKVLQGWLQRTREAVGEGFPDKVTAFRDGMAVHGRYRQPCPACASPIQRIVYAENECNYCARCQTGGRLLADRALSRLLKANWPRTLAELEQRS
ncbi:MAG: formamidopyrimidine-DNA glycosylase [Gammaproteobacteria bacterium]|nr:formamidopyrimidine-DNA glycosylase [Gammaproteobacteria bacterium]